MTIEGQALREVTKTLERQAEWHDDDCGCGPCVLLQALAEAEARKGEPVLMVVTRVQMPTDPHHATKATSP